MTKRPIGMWIRYDDTSLEYSTYPAPVQSALARKLSEVWQYLGQSLLGQLARTTRTATHATGNLFDALLHRRKAK